MSLLAYNMTTSPLALAAGTPTVTLPASSVVNTRGPAYNVTAELKGLSDPQYALLQAQVASGLVQYEWSTGIPEFPVGTLSVGQVAADVAENNVDIYVNGSTGNDANPGGLTNPVATIGAAQALVPPIGWKKRCRIIMDADGVGRSYVFPGPLAGFGLTAQLGQPIGAFSSPLIYIGARVALSAQAAETVGGSNNTYTPAGGTIAATAVTDNPLSNAATTINVTSTAGFQTAGILKVDNEIIRYTGVTGTSFTGCVRGFAGTAAVSHVVTSSIFQFLAGHYLQQTANATIVTDNPLTSGATTVNVGSTGGYPSASTIRIDNELITYTGKTGTSFTGCTRGTNNTVAAVHGAGSAVTLIGQRLGIKSNTATAITVSVNFAVNLAIGDTLTVNTAGTTVTASSVAGGPPSMSQVGFKDCILGGGLNINVGQLILRACNVVMAGSAGFTAGPSTGVISFATSVANALWLPDGADSPCLAQENNAGIRFEGQGATQNTNVVALRSSGHSNTVGDMVLIHAALTVDSLASSFNTLVTLHGGSLTIKEGGYFRLDNVNATNRCLLSGAQFIVQRGGVAKVNRFDINNVLTTGSLIPTGSGIVVEEGGLLTISDMAGTGNAGYGLECRDGVVRSLDTLSTVTGILGDIKCGARPVRQWTDFNAAVPTSTLPSKVEFDVPNFYARPFKLAFTGLTAATSFDITTLAPFASPVSASRGLVATTSVGGSFAIAGSTVTFTAPAPAVGTAFSAADVGTRITIAGATSGGNNGTFTILTAVGNVVTYTNATGVTEAGAGTYAFTATSSIWQNTPPALLSGSTLRVTAVGTAALGTRTLSDVGETPSATVATISNDGKTVTFEGTVTGFTLEYSPIAGLVQATASMGGRVYQQNANT